MAFERAGRRSVTMPPEPTFHPGYRLEGRFAEPGADRELDPPALRPGTGSGRCVWSKRTTGESTRSEVKNDPSAACLGIGATAKGLLQARERHEQRDGDGLDGGERGERHAGRREAAQRAFRRGAFEVGKHRQLREHAKGHELEAHRDRGSETTWVAVEAESSARKKQSRRAMFSSRRLLSETNLAAAVNSSRFDAVRTRPKMRREFRGRTTRCRPRRGTFSAALDIRHGRSGSGAPPAPRIARLVEADGGEGCGGGPRERQGASAAEGTSARDAAARTSSGYGSLMPRRGAGRPAAGRHRRRGSDGWISIRASARDAPALPGSPPGATGSRAPPAPPRPRLEKRQGFPAVAEIARSSRPSDSGIERAGRRFPRRTPRAPRPLVLPLPDDPLLQARRLFPVQIPDVVPETNSRSVRSSAPKPRRAEYAVRPEDDSSK